MSITKELARRTRYMEPVGSVHYFLKNAVPDSFIAMNGAVITITVYQELADLLYCGDVDNATADWGYRCTDSGDPDNTRDIAGEYMVLPDARGVFVRGYDNGRGFDVGRSFHSEQSHGFQEHGHNLTTGRNDTGSAHSSGSATGHVGAGFSQSYNVGAGWVRSAAPVTSGGDSINSSEETRPRNIAAIACIKYK